MHQDSESYWVDIKNYEERLAKKPESFLFARLSEIYLKVQLVDDALNIARQGVARYPAYISGLRALAMASHAKGLNDECLQALRKVAASSPEDVEAQKLLGKLLSEAGDYSGARMAFETALEFCPDDSECRFGLEGLGQVSGHAGTDFSSAAGFGFGPLVDEPEDEIIELTESDIVVEQEAVSFAPMPEAAAASVRHDPLTTGTLAELYVQQGFVEKALDIYRAIQADNPGNEAVRARIAELETKESAVPEPSRAPDETFAASFCAPLQVTKDAMIGTMEAWLDNIRRLRLCR